MQSLAVTAFVVLFAALCLGDEPSPSTQRADAAVEQTTDEATSLRITRRGDEDQLDCSTTEYGTTLAIHSPSGYGGATVERTGDVWPADMKVRVFLANLDEFVVTGGAQNLTLKVGTANGSLRVAVHPSDSEKLDAAAIQGLRFRKLNEMGTTETKDLTANGSFEICLPKGLFATNSRSIEIKWAGTANE